MGEVAANMAFNGLKIGQRIQVDINDPVVQGLIRGGYFRIIWREHASGVDSAVDPGGVESVPAGGMGSGGAGDTPTEAVSDGAGEHQSAAQDYAGAAGDDTSRSSDQ